MVYTFLITLYKRRIPQLTSRTPHLNNKHTKQLWFPLLTRTLCSTIHFSTPPSSLNKHDESKPAALIPTQHCLMYAITLICKEGCQWKPNTRTSAFLTNVPRCNPAQQKKLLNIPNWTPQSRRVFACFHSQEESRLPPSS